MYLPSFSNISFNMEPTYAKGIQTRNSIPRTSLCLHREVLLVRFVFPFTFILSNSLQVFALLGFHIFSFLTFGTSCSFLSWWDRSCSFSRCLLFLTFIFFLTGDFFSSFRCSAFLSSVIVSSFFFSSAGTLMTSSTSCAWILILGNCLTCDVPNFTTLGGVAIADIRPPCSKRLRMSSKGSSSGRTHSVLYFGLVMAANSGNHSTL